MLNQDKFKTAEERIRAFYDWCIDIRVGGECHACKLSKIASHWVCFAYWLALEADEETPENCPFCGDECYADDGATPRVVCINKDSCCYQGAIAKNKADAIAAHNRVARAVRAAREGEVK